MRFPAVDPVISDDQLAQKLKSWIVTRKAEAAIGLRLQT
jgi:hypothetical protein